MIISDFWNQAFISALGRLPADEASREADIATGMCVEHWQKRQNKFAPMATRRRHEQDITLVPENPRHPEVDATCKEASILDDSTAVCQPQAEARRI